MGRALSPVNMPAVSARVRSGPIGDWDLSGYWTNPFDQGASETCFAHSFATMLAVALKTGSPSQNLILSPQLLASCTYSLEADEALPPGATGRGPLVDQGAELSDVARAGNQIGVAPMGPTQPGRFSDVPEVGSAPFPEPDQRRLEVAAKKIVSGQYSIPVDAPELDLVDACGSSGIPTWIGGPVGPGYQGLQPGQVALPEPGGSGHAQGVMGRKRLTVAAVYPTMGGGSVSFPAGTRLWKIVNSWGAWCDNGYCWVPDAWLLGQWSWWPFQARVVNVAGPSSAVPQ